MTSSIASTRKSGFTLFEILVVISILLILTAILFPVFSRAKRSAHGVGAISNLRQCGLAILMYTDEHGGLSMLPTGTSAFEMLKGAPTCDPLDTWRQGCQGEVGDPMIGSYAYLRNVKSFQTDEGWSWLQSVHDFQLIPITLMISPFASDRPVKFREGFGFLYENPYPDPFFALKSDGSVHKIHWAPDYMVSSGWESVFLRQKG